MPSNNMCPTDTVKAKVSLGAVSRWCDLTALVREPSISGNSIPYSAAQSTAEDITGRLGVYLLTRFAVILSPEQFLRKR